MSIGPYFGVVREIPGRAYISDSDNPRGDNYWAEDESCRLQVERTDHDEIRVGVMLGKDTQEAAGVYISRREASNLMIALAQAIGDR